MGQTEELLKTDEEVMLERIANSPLKKFFSNEKDYSVLVEEAFEKSLKAS